jgi:hypothetical protein
MKLKELIEQILGDLQTETNIIDVFNDTLTGEKKLSLIKDKLLECEEFSECEELLFLDKPVYEDTINDKKYLVETFKVYDGHKISGKVWLYSIMLTPKMYQNEFTTVKDGAGITPILYNPITFNPMKKIMLEFNPQDNPNQLHDLMDKVINNPSEYEIKGERYALIRCYIENNK